jgi:hypothetical protein
MKNALFASTCAAAFIGWLSASTNSNAAVLQWGFDSTSGAVAVPVTDDSGSGHDGAYILFGAAPNYSADIPVASRTQYVTGIGSIDFSGTNGGISTADSTTVGSGQGIITAAQVSAAGGLTMEVWVKNPSGTGTPEAALNIAGMYLLGTKEGKIGFFHGDKSTDMSWTTDQFIPDQWNHLAVVMTTTDPDAQAYDDITVYLNGTPFHSGSYTLPFFLDRAASVGNHQYNDWSNYDGLVYEPRISLGTLSPSEFTVVPEPSSTALFGLLAAIGLFCRRRG